MTLLISEHSLSKTRRYKYESSERQLKPLHDEHASSGSGAGANVALSSSLLITFRQIFLPHGYPGSVSSDYAGYQIWDTVQAFCSSITGALATEAVMRGVGVGNVDASSLAAAITWLLKNGTGMIGAIVFTWAKGTSLDHDNKKWRLFADILNDFATLVDLVTPFFPMALITWIFCISSIARALVGVAGGATRAAITQHQARSNNSADVQAKDGSQETLVNLASLIISLILLPAVSGKTALVWTLFCLFTILHIYANYRAVKSLEIEVLNRSRLLILLDSWIRDGRIPSVKEANQRENVFLGFGLSDVDVCGFRIELGSSVSECPGKILEELIQDSGSGIPKKFLIWSDPNQSIKTIHVILHQGISSIEIIEAFSRAVIGAAIGANAESESETSRSWLEFRYFLNSYGFNLNQVSLDTGNWRAVWGSEKSKSN